MKALWIGIGAAALVAAAIAWVPNAAPPAQAQVNAEGCSCSRPTALGQGSERLTVYYCTCPAIQCVVTATAATSTMPPNVAQNCAAIGGR